MKVAGEIIVLTATYKDKDGNLVTPGEPVKLSVRKPDGKLDPDVKDKTLSKSSTGVYSYEYETDINQHGDYWFIFESADGEIDQWYFYMEENRKNIPST